MLTLEGEYVIHLAKTTKLVRLKDNVLGSAGLLLFFFIAISLINKNGFGSITNAICTIFVLLLFSLFSYICICIIYHSYFPKDNPIRIGGEGIVDDRGILYPWNKIEYAHFRAITKSCYLQIYYKNADNQSLHYEINLKEYDFDERKIAGAIEYWSGRDIGDYEDYMIDDYVKQQVEEGKITEEQSKVLDEKLSLYTPYFQKKQKEYKMYIIWLLPILVIVYFISKYLCDVNTPLDMYKWFSIIKFLSLRSGFLVLYVFCLGLVGDYKTKKLRRNPDLKDLSEKELDHLLDVHEMKESSLAIKILLILTAIWLFFVIYTILVDYGVLS